MTSLSSLLDWKNLKLQLRVSGIYLLGYSLFLTMQPGQMFLIVIWLVASYPMIALKAHSTLIWDYDARTNGPPEKWLWLLRSFFRGTNHHKKMITFLNNKLLMSPVQYLAHEEVICLAWFEEDCHSVLKTYFENLFGRLVIYFQA